MASTEEQVKNPQNLDNVETMSEGGSSVKTLDSAFFAENDMSRAGFSLKAMIRALDDEETPLYDADASLDEFTELYKLQVRKRDAMMKKMAEDNQHIGEELESFLNNLDMGETEGSLTSESSDTEEEMEELAIPRTIREDPELYAEVDKVIKENVCVRISDQFMKRSFRARVGNPSCIKVSTSYIGIGTMYGLVLVFLTKDESLHIIIGSIWNELGGGVRNVTSLAFSPTEESLVVGYSDCEICFWDIKTGGIIARLANSFPTPIDNIEYLGDKTKIVAADQVGGAKIFTLSRKFFANSIDATIISENAGFPIIQMAVLNIRDSLSKFNNSTFLALANKKKVTISIFNPNPRSIFSIENTSFGSSDEYLQDIPYIAWRNIKREDKLEHQDPFDVLTSLKNPTLALARGRTIVIFEVLPDCSVSEKCKIILESEIRGIDWISDEVIAVIDERENFTVLDMEDVDQICMVETYNLARIKRLNHKHFKLENFHRVLNPETNTFEQMKTSNFFHNSYSSVNGKIYVLGEQILSVVGVKSWSERIENFSKAGFWEDALRLALEFYDKRAKAAIGLPYNQNARDKLVSDMISTLITKYLEVSMNPMFFQPSNENEFYPHLGNIVINFSLQINRLELLYGPILEKFRASEKQDLFIDLLVEPITKGRLRLIEGKLVDAFVSRLVKTDKVKELEECFCNIDATKIDFNTMLGYCNQYEMFQAIIYTYNYVKSEYVQPIQLMIGKFNEVKGKSKKQPELVDTLNKVGDVIMTTFMKFIKGEVLPQHKSILEKIKQDVIQLVFSTDASALIKTKPIYIFSVLLDFNAKRFFEVLIHAMDDDSPSSPWRHVNKQQKIDILINNVVDKTKGPDVLSETELDTKIELFLFLARYFAKGALTTTDDIYLRLFTHLGHYIEHQKDISEKNRVESLLIGVLIYNPKLEQTKFSKFISVAKRHNLYRVCMHMYKKVGNTDAYVDAMLCDVVNSIQYDEDSYSKQFLQQISVQDFDIQKKAFDWLCKKLTAIPESDFNLEQHRDFRALSYKYMSSFFATIKSESQNDNFTANLKAKGIILNNVFHFIYIQLLNEFHKERTVEYLRDVQDQNLSLNKLKVLCKDNAEARSYLFERTGEIAKSIRELITEFQPKLMNLQQRLMNEADIIDSRPPKSPEETNKRTDYERNLAERVSRYIIFDDPPVYLANQSIDDQKVYFKKERQDKYPLPHINNSDVLEIGENLELLRDLDTALTLCSHNSERKTLDDAEVQDLWFMLLNTFAHLIRRLKYGFYDIRIAKIVKKPVVIISQQEKNAKKPKKKAKDLDAFSDDEDEGGESGDEDGERDMSKLDSIEGIQKEMNEVRVEADNLEQKIQQETDKMKILRLEKRLETKKNHVQNLKNKLKEKEEEKKKQEELEKQRENDMTAPHNIHRLTNLWYQRCLGKCIRNTLKVMTRYIEIPTIIQEFVNDHATDEFLSVRLTIIRLLYGYTFEKMLLGTANGLMSTDVFNLGKILFDGKAKSILPTGDNCPNCKNSLTKLPKGEVLVFFNCQHAFHLSCIPQNLALCPICAYKESANADEKPAKLKINLEESTSTSKGSGKYYILEQIDDKIGEKVTQVFGLIDTLVGMDPSKTKLNAADKAMNVLKAQMGQLDTSAQVKLQLKLPNSSKKNYIRFSPEGLLNAGNKKVEDKDEEGEDGEKKEKKEGEEDEEGEGEDEEDEDEDEDDDEEDDDSDEEDDD